MLAVGPILELVLGNAGVALMGSSVTGHSRASFSSSFFLSPSSVLDDYGNRKKPKGPKVSSDRPCGDRNGE